MKNIKIYFVLAMLLSIVSTRVVWGSEDITNPENFIVEQLDKLNISDLQNIRYSKYNLEEHMPRIDIKTFIKNI